MESDKIRIEIASIPNIALLIRATVETFTRYPWSWASWAPHHPASTKPPHRRHGRGAVEPASNARSKGFAALLCAGPAATTQSASDPPFLGNRARRPMRLSN